MTAPAPPLPLPPQRVEPIIGRPPRSERRARVVVAIASAAFLGVGLFLMASLHRRYGTQTFDMAIFDQGVWLLSRFHDPFVTLRGLNLFADHSSYIFLLLAPLYWVAPNVHTLMLVAAGSLAAGGPLTYAIGRRLGLDPWPAAGVALAYLLHPAVAWNVWDVFHPHVIAVPLMLGAFLAAQCGRWRWTIALLVLTLLIREDAAIAVVPLALYLAWRFRRPIAGFGVALAGVVLMAVNLLMVLPGLSPDGTLAVIGPRYTQFGTGIGEILSGMARRPRLVVSELLGQERITYYLQLLGPLPTAFLAPELLLVAGPITAVNVLSSLSYQYDIRYHYTTYAIALATVAAAAGAARLIAMFGRQRTVASMVIAAAVAGSLLVGPWEPLREGNPWNGTANDPAAASGIGDALELIPPEAPVAADWSVAPHLAHRQEIYMLPNPFEKRFYGAGEAYGPDGDDVDYVVASRVIIDTDAQVRRIFEGLAGDPEWVTVVDDDHVMLMARRATP